MKIHHVFAYMKLVISLLAILLNNSLYALCIGNDILQEQFVANVQRPQVEISNPPKTLSSNEAITLTASANIDASGKAYFYWCTDKGKLQYVSNSPNYRQVKYIAPNVSSSTNAKLYVRVGDSLGYVHTDAITINVESENNTQPTGVLKVEALGLINTGSVNVSPKGISCGTNCYTYNENTTTTIQANPASGYVFDRWVGGKCDQKRTTQCQVNVIVGQQAKEVAIFVKEEIPNVGTLKFGTFGLTGSFSVSPKGTSCGTNCYTYNENTTTTIQANPASGYIFDRWVGGTCDGKTITQCKVNVVTGVTSNETALFVQPKPPLTDYIQPSTWSQVTTTNNGTQYIYSTVYGNGKYVAVGTTDNSSNGDGIVLQSTDAKSWSQVSTTNLDNIKLLDIAYDSSVWVAVGEHTSTHSGRIFYSQDLVNWEQVPYHYPDSVNAIHYANGKWIAVGDNDVLEYSDNGKDWHSTSLRSESGRGTFNFKGVTYKTGKWVAVSDSDRSNQIATSTDGVVWYVSNFDDAYYNLQDIATDGNQFIAVGFHNPVYRVEPAILISQDGNSWENVAPSGMQNTSLFGIAYVYNGWVIASGQQKIATSTDGRNWNFYDSSVGYGRVKLQYSKSQSTLLATTGSSIYRAEPLQEYQVNVKVIGNGTISYDGKLCTDTCTDTYPDGTELRFSLEDAEEGWILDSWGGDCDSTSMCGVKVDSNKAVIANFSSKFPDSDSDGMTDNIDTDDDNDGMPDIFENQYAFLNPLEYSDAFVDYDKDGTSNLEEYQNKTDPSISDLPPPDSDGDGVVDTDDAFPYNANETIDSDKDGIGNNADYDDDNDGMSDSFENQYSFLNSLNSADANLDQDTDGISNVDEYRNGTNPSLRDSDSDGVNDNVDIFPTNPAESVDSDKDGIGNNADTDDDGDGMPDDFENQYSFLNPLNPSDANLDQDGDGVSNLEEYRNGTDPSQKEIIGVDTDGDGIEDSVDTDDDNDGMPDDFENQYSFLNPLDPSDAAADQDGDGVSNLEEYQNGTDPSQKEIIGVDTDGDDIEDSVDTDDDNDGMPDDFENQYSFLNPLDPSDAILDQDGDGASNLEEYQNGTAPSIFENIIPIPDYQIKSIAVNSNYAYAIKLDNSIDILDITDLKNPILVGRYESDKLSTIYGISILSNYAYIVGQGGLEVINISNSTQLVYAAHLAVESGEIITNVITLGHYAYLISDGLTNKRSGTFSIVDIETPSNLKVVSQISQGMGTLGMLSGIFGSNKKFTISGDYAYIIGEDYYFQVIDISNVYNPRIIGSLTLARGINFTKYVPYDLVIHGNFAYISTVKGLIVIDISDPVAPKWSDNSLQKNISDISIFGTSIYAVNNRVLDIISMGDNGSVTYVDELLFQDNIEKITIFDHYAYVIFDTGKLQFIDLNRLSDIFPVNIFQEEQQTIRLAVVNTPSEVKPGESFDLTLQFVPDIAQPADGIQVYIEFDPTKLKVNSVTNTGVLDFELANEIGSNFINFAAASWANEVPTQPFDLVTINVTALDNVDGAENTTLHFVTDKSEINSGGKLIPQEFEDIVINFAQEIPEMTLNPNTLSFDEVKLGKTSTAQTISVQNTGNAELLIDNVSDATGFKVNHNCNQALPPDGTCQINVLFEPTEEKAYIATISVTSNADNGTQQVILTGTGIKPPVLCKVTLQGRPTPPDASWVTNLDITTNLDKQANIITDNMGQCEIPDTLLPFSTDEHSLCVTNAHTLQNEVEIPPVDSVIDFGELVEGDLNRNNLIDSTDFSMLFARKNQCDGDAEFEKTYDLNADGCINMSDAKLVQDNFSKQGDSCEFDSVVATTSSTSSYGSRNVSRRVRSDNNTLYATAIPNDLQVGDEFEFDIKVYSKAGVDAVAAYLNFTPELVKVNHLRINSAFDVVLQDEFDNTTGQINAAAGVWDNEMPTGEVVLVTVNATVLQTSDETYFSFNKTSPRSTTAVSGGQVVIDSNEDIEEIAFDDVTFEATIHVLDIDGQPVNNQEVDVSGVQFVTNDLGIVYLDGLEQDEYVVTTDSENHTYKSQTFVVSYNTRHATVYLKPSAPKFTVETEWTPTKVYEGDTSGMLYQPVITNNGEQIATNVQLSFNLAPNATAISAKIDAPEGFDAGTCNIAGQVITCDIMDLLPNEGITASIIAMPSGTDTMVNVAQVSSEEYPPHTNTLKIGITPYFAVNSWAEPNRVLKDNYAVLKIRLSNNPFNTTEVNSILTKLPIPFGVEFESYQTDAGNCQYAEHTLTCNVNPIPVGEYVDIDVTVKSSVVGKHAYQVLTTSSFRDQEINRWLNVISPLPAMPRNADIFIAFDITGSMEDNLEAAKGAVKQFVELAKDKAVKPKIGLVFFKDDAQVVLVTDDLQLVIDKLDSVVPSGGDEQYFCREASEQAIIKALDSLKIKDGVILLVTDAPPHPDTDLDTALSIMQSEERKVTFNALVAGDECNAAKFNTELQERLNTRRLRVDRECDTTTAEQTADMRELYQCMADETGGTLFDHDVVNSGNESDIAAKQADMLAVLTGVLDKLNSSDDTGDGDTGDDESDEGKDGNREKLIAVDPETGTILPPPVPEAFWVFVGSPNGHVVSQPAGIDCNKGYGQCFYYFKRGTKLELIPTAPEGLYFDSWYGDVGCEDGEFTVTGTKGCSAVFYGIPGYQK